MHSLSNQVQFNPFLTRLTQGQRNLAWLRGVTRHGLILWIGACFLIRATDLDQFWRVLYATSHIGLPLSMLVLLALWGVLVFSGTQLTFTEMHNERLDLLRLTNISQPAIFSSLVTGVIYRLRRGLGLIIGASPVWLWLICGWRTFGTYLSWPDAICYPSALLGYSSTYCYFDAPIEDVRWFEFLWFLCLTVSILGIGLLAIQCCVGFALKTKNATCAAVGGLALTLPPVIVVAFFLAPDGFLFIDTVYEIKRWSVLYWQVLCAGSVIAVLPFIVSFGVQRFLRQWSFR